MYHVNKTAFQPSALIYNPSQDKIVGSITDVMQVPEDYVGQDYEFYCAECADAHHHAKKFDVRVIKGRPLLIDADRNDSVHMCDNPFRFHALNSYHRYDAVERETHVYRFPITIPSPQPIGIYSAKRLTNVLGACWYDRPLLHRQDFDVDGNIVSVRDLFDVQVPDSVIKRATFFHPIARADMRLVRRVEREIFGHHGLSLAFSNQTLFEEACEMSLVKDKFGRTNGNKTRPFFVYARSEVIHVSSGVDTLTRRFYIESADQIFPWEHGEIDEKKILKRHKDFQKTAPREITKLPVQQEFSL